MSFRHRKGRVPWMGFALLRSIVRRMDISQIPTPSALAGPHRLHRGTPRPDELLISMSGVSLYRRRSRWAQLFLRRICTPDCSLTDRWWHGARGEAHATSDCFRPMPVTGGVGPFKKITPSLPVRSGPVLLYEIWFTACLIFLRYIGSPKVYACSCRCDYSGWWITRVVWGKLDGLGKAAA